MRKNPNDRGIIIKKNKTTGKPEYYARIVRVVGAGVKKEFTAKADSKAHARRLRDELASKYQSRGEKGIEGTKLLFREAADEYQKARLIPAVYHGTGKNRRKVAGVRSLANSLSYLKILKEHFGHMRVNSITHADLEAFKMKRIQTPTRQGTERSMSDVNATLSLLRTMMKFFKQQGWIPESPFELGRPIISRADEFRREVTLSYEEEDRLLAECQGRRSHLRSLIIVAVDTAMRRGELLKLKWSDVNFGTGMIHVLAMNTKTARSRDIAMTERVKEALEQLWSLSDKNPATLVFGIKDNFKRSFSYACKKAGLKDFHFHDLRHTSISRMIKLGFAPLEIMKISGHTQINVFSRYVNPDSTTVKDVAERLSRFNAERKG